MKVAATPEIVSRMEWERAREELLVREKEHTRASDAIAADRRRLPMTPMEPVTVLGSDGCVPLQDVFEGRRMLIVYHFMWKEKAPHHKQCGGCTHSQAAMSAAVCAYLAERDVTYADFSSGPLEVVRFSIEGAELAVRLAGDQDAPAVLLTHGLPNSSAYFRNVISRLSQDCFVIAPDLPGFGGSEPIKQPSFSRYADLITELLVQLGVDSFHLYLHDFGANVGLYLPTLTKVACMSATTLYVSSLSWNAPLLRCRRSKAFPHFEPFRSQETDYQLRGVVASPLIQL